MLKKVLVEVVAEVEAMEEHDYGVSAGYGWCDD